MTGMKIIVDRKYRSLESYVEQLPVTFNTGELVYAARNVLRRFCWDGTIVVVKKYKIPILLNRSSVFRVRPHIERERFPYPSACCLYRGTLLPIVVRQLFGNVE